MDIVVKGRHTEVSEGFRAHAVDKLGRIERFDHKVIRLDVEVSHESNPRLHPQCERIELTCHSRGPVIRAEAAADDPYAALDRAYDKLQMKLRKLADRRRVHRGRKTPVSTATATATSAPSAAVTAAAEAAVGSRPVPGAPQSGAPRSAAAPDEASPGVGVLSDDALGGVDGDGPLVVREKVHETEPMTLDQALFEMELVGHDFYLFLDKDSGWPSVVYRRRGYDYGVIKVRPKS